MAQISSSSTSLLNRIQNIQEDSILLGKKQGKQDEITLVAIKPWSLAGIAHAVRAFFYPKAVAQEHQNVIEAIQKEFKTD